MIRLENISKIYNKGKENEVHALSGINLNIEAGEMIAVTGPSGSGKSTLFSILALLETPTGGAYYLNGEDVIKESEKKQAARRNKEIALVLQDYGLIGRLSAVQNAELPLLISDMPAAEARGRALEALGKVGLSDKAKEKTNHLSGGQQQRVAISRAMAAGAGILLADEPTGALDTQTSRSIMELFQTLNEQGTTILVATHDPLVAEYCKRWIHLEDGRIKEDSRQ